VSLITRLVYARRGLLGRVAKELLALYGIEVPAEVEVGENLRVLHRGFGTVIHPRTTIGADVRIYHGVTIGRADPWVPWDEAQMERIVIGDGAVLCPGAKVICAAGTLTVAPGTIVGTNAVLMHSTGPGEIWAGVPARLIRKRRDWN
jgi:serine O-acetyltransferase